MFRENSLKIVERPCGEQEVREKMEECLANENTSSVHGSLRVFGQSRAVWHVRSAREFGLTR